MSRTITGLRRELVDTVGVLLAQARSALFLTGSGLTADAGLPVYRGMPGVRARKADRITELDASLSADTFVAEPETVWRQLVRLDAAVRAAKPASGHVILAELGKRLRTVIATTNVDRLHQRAGSREVIELHGALHDLRCDTCEMSSRHDSFAALPIPPRCAVCRTALRPDMPLLGEPLPIDPFTRLQAELDQGFDLVFAIGIRRMAPYLARPLLIAKADGIPTIEIGPHPSELSEVVDYRFRGACSRVLAAVWEVFARMDVPPRT